ncbi:DUF2510 domain-containing protein [Cellulomonas sp. ICMP 17802]|uniref:DUF2510 domain-containing protein n=1 Tax=Cellulomonas sp. ICMP 17802 TaxID=3239199 RepID=UPI00351BD845
MESPPPNWYPSPDADGWLRWWDGTRWTPNVQPAPAPGRVPLGIPVSEGGARLTYTPPGVTPTHVYPPLSDPRYAGSPLAAAYLAAEERRDPGGDVAIPYEQQAAVEAAYQARLRGGVVGALATSAELAAADAVRDPRSVDPTDAGTARPRGWVVPHPPTAGQAALGIVIGAVVVAIAVTAARERGTPVVWWFLVFATALIAQSAYQLVAAIRRRERRRSHGAAGSSAAAAPPIHL